MRIGTRSIWFVALIAFLVLASGAAAWGVEATGTVQGTVHAPDGSGVRGVVYFYHVNDNGTLNATDNDALTGDDGEWSAEVPVGDYMLMYQPWDDVHAEFPFWSAQGPVPLSAMADTVTVTTGSQQTCDTTLPVAFKIQGAVTQHADGMGRNDFAVTPWLLDEESGEWLDAGGMAPSPVDGSYRLKLLPGYKYRLQWGDPWRTFPWTVGFWEGASELSDATTLTALPGLTLNADFELRVKVTSEIVAGAGRIQTSIAASQKLYPGEGEGDPDAVIISTGYNWPDALSGSALAYAADGPLLLTSPAPAPMPADLLAEVQRLKAEGASRAYILGGEPAVGSAVYDQLETVFGEGNVARLGGTNRYETAAMVATNTIERRGPGNFDGTVMIARGDNFVDALAASAVSAKMGWPVLLAQPDGHGGLSDAMTEFIDEHATKAIILGSAKAVSSGVASDVAGALGGAQNVERWEGADRFETAVTIAEKAIAYPGSPIGWNGLAFSYGWNYPDALACGPLVADGQASVILLTPDDPSLTPALKARLKALAAAATVEEGAVVDHARFLGGSPVLLRKETRAALMDALQ